MTTFFINYIWRIIPLALFIYVRKKVLRGALAYICCELAVLWECSDLIWNTKFPINHFLSTL